MESMPIQRRDFLKSAFIGGCALAARPFISQAWSAAPEKLAQAPACNRIPGTKFQLGGRVQDYLSGVTAQWLKVAPLSNPAMLEMFRDRERHPLRDMVPWAGEFAGNGGAS